MKALEEIFETATVEISETAPWSRVWEVSLPGEEIARLKRGYLKDYGKSLDIPGFRKGKIPLEIIKSRIGDQLDSLFADDLGQAFLKWYASKESIPLTLEPSFEMTSSDDGRDLLKIEAQIVPPFTLPKYKGLKCTLRKEKISDADVEAFIEQTRKSGAKVVPKAGELKLGDVAEISMLRVAEGGLSLIGEKERNMSILLSPENVPEDLLAALVGMKEGGSSQVSLKRAKGVVETPAETGDHELYKITVVKALTLEFPDMSQLALLFGIDDPEELPARIRILLEDDAERKAREQLRSDLTSQLAGSADIQLPPSLVESRAEEIRLSLVESAANESEEAKKNYSDPAFFLEQHRESVELSLREHLIIEEVASNENLVATREQVETVLISRARGEKISPKRMRQKLGEDGLSSLRRRITRSNVEDLLEDEAEVELSEYNDTRDNGVA